MNVVARVRSFVLCALRRAPYHGKSAGTPAMTEHFLDLERLARDVNAWDMKAKDMKA